MLGVVFNSLVSIILLINLVFVKIISLIYLETLYFIVFSVSVRCSWLCFCIDFIT